MIDAANEEFCSEPVMCALLIGIFFMLTVPGWAIVYWMAKALGF